jgi:hypothetical protein
MERVCVRNLRTAQGGGFQQTNRGRNDETNSTPSARAACVGFLRILGAGAPRTLNGARVAAIAKDRFRTLDDLHSIYLCGKIPGVAAR